MRVSIEDDTTRYLVAAFLSAANVDRQWQVVLDGKDVKLRIAKRYCYRNHERLETSSFAHETIKRAFQLAREL